MHELRGKRVLVTGAAGFIGANLVRQLLAHGADVVGLVRAGGSSTRVEQVDERVELVAADMRSGRDVEAAVARARPELAVNLAMTAGHPLSPDERLAQLEVSVLGTARLVESLALTGCTRLVHVGSSLEYGSKLEPMREEDVLAPTVPRGAAKAAATHVCLVWARTLKVSALVLRPFSVYGPWEPESRFVPSVLRAAIEGSVLPLTEPGIVHDFVYVDDVAEAILLGLTAPRETSGCVVNIGSGVQTTNEELVEIVGRVVGRKIKIQPGAYAVKPHDSTWWSADVERARLVLGWTASTTVEQGLRRMLAWMEAGAAPLLR
jgi:nucleoside-diphosphate-sugar epimerase